VVEASCGDKPEIDWASLTYADFARMAGDGRLSKYEKIGFPDSYRAGYEEAIFADIRTKLLRLGERGMTVLDIGPGCSDVAAMLIRLCEEQGHQLHLVDSPEMLSQLPDRGCIRKHPGKFPQCRDDLAGMRGQVQAILCYSVFHYVFVEASAFEFVDVMLELLSPGGEALVGDIPNISKRRRFFGSAAGVAFHRSFTGTETSPSVEYDVPVRGLIDDAVVAAVVARARAGGADAYVLPQPPTLPMANRREDILIRKP
jgi:hypothetical protein